MVEVNRTNYEQQFPHIVKAIENADFIAIDTEFSGLKLSEKERPSLFDSGEERYAKLRRSISAFTVTQIGLSAFIKKENSNKYEAETYNCFLFPRSFGPLDVRFSFQASSIDFLCKHQFDFNKVFYEGISFHNQEEEKLLRQGLANEDLFSGTDREVDERLLQSVCTTVAEWCVKADIGKNLTLDIVNGVETYIIHKELRFRFRNIWTEELENGQIKVLKISKDKRLEYEKEYKQQEENRILDEIMGFSRIFHKMVSCKKPLVGHNCLMDLMFMYDKFYKPLPENYAKFKQEFTKLFPTVYDTKNITAALRKKYESTELLRNTGLGELYQSLDSTAGKFHVICSPDIGHAPEFQRYKDVHCPHEAGYDAFMCGYVFIRIAHIYANEGKLSSDVKFLKTEDYLRRLAHFKNKINLIRAAISHIVLDASDPESRKPQWLYVKSRKKGNNLMINHLAGIFSQYGSVDVRLQSTSEALVAVGHFRSAKDILQNFHKHEKLYVTRYSFLRHSPVVRNIMWTGVLASGLVVAWTIYDGLKHKPS